METIPMTNSEGEKLKIMELKVIRSIVDLNRIDDNEYKM